jgi:hypothetical protein
VGFDQASRRKLYNLTFRPFPGLLVRCRKPGMRALELLTEVVTPLGDDFEGTGMSSPERVRHWGALFEAFARSLVGWDLTTDGTPVPATIDGVFDQDSDFLLQVSRAWYYAVVLHQEIAEPATAVADQTDGPQADPPDDDAAEREQLLAYIPVTDVELPTDVADAESDLVPA